MMAETIFRKSKALTSALIGVIALLIPTAAVADSLRNDEFVSPGAYLVLGGFTAFTDFKDISSDFDTSLGFMLRGGYRINPIFALEAEGNFIAGWDTHDGEPPPGPAQGNLTLDGGTATVNALAYLPLGRLQPHVLVGLGGMWAQLRTTNTISQDCSPDDYWYCQSVYLQLDHSGSFVMKFGGGLDYYLTRDWAVVLDASYVLPFGDLKDLRYVSLNWGVRFSF
ncbi:MAG: outer membrane beta-barrel protein [Myxococcota bacterium]